VQPRQSTNHRSFFRDRLRRPPVAASDYVGSVPRASLPVAELGIHWRIFDGGVRKNEVLIAESKRREAEDELTTIDDERRASLDRLHSVPDSIAKADAAVSLLESANASTRHRSMLQIWSQEPGRCSYRGEAAGLARLSSVSARSELFLEAVNLNSHRKPAETSRQRRNFNLRTGTNDSAMARA